MLLFQLDCAPNISYHFAPLHHICRNRWLFSYHRFNICYADCLAFGDDPGLVLQMSKTREGFWGNDGRRLKMTVRI